MRDFIRRAKDIREEFVLLGCDCVGALCFSKRRTAI